MQNTDLLILSRAVHQWYLYYDLDPDDQASTLLNRAAVELFDQDHRSVEGIATVLIENYVGPWPLARDTQVAATLQSPCA